MSEKLCMFCKHFDYKQVEYTYYSTLTGGDINGGMTCKRRHYCDVNPWDTEGFRNIILKAESCPDYTPPEKS